MADNDSTNEAQEAQQVASLVGRLNKLNPNDIPTMDPDVAKAMLGELVSGPALKLLTDAAVKAAQGRWLPE